MKFSSKTMLLAGVGASLVFGAFPAFADEASADNESAKSDEIVVTARRREESILKVPVVASVLGGEELVKTGTSDLSGVSNFVPGLNLATAVSSFGTQVSLRGIGTTTLNATIDQSVSLNIDGMQITQGLSYGMGFFDAAHVEVLKGPQALFYGKASPAGVISIRSADPTDTFEVSGRIGYEFEAREYKGELVVSGPLTDTLGVRLAASYAEGKGYFHNVGAPGNVGTLADIDPAFGFIAPFYGPLGSLGGGTPGFDRVPDSHNLMLRGTLLWRPTSDLTVRFKVSYGDMKLQGGGFDVSPSSCPDGTAATAGIPYLAPTEDCTVDRYIHVIGVDPADFPTAYNNGIPFSQVKQGFGTLDINYNVAPDLTLSSLTGYYNLKQTSMTNGSSSSYAGPPFVVQGVYKRHDFTQELRLTSDYAGPLNFMLGAFYQTGKQDFLVDVPTNKSQSELFGLLGAFKDGSVFPLIGQWMGGYITNAEFGAALHAFPGLPPSLGQGRHVVDTDAFSVFGQGLWKIVPDLELGIGARWTTETRKERQMDLMGNITPLAVPKLHSSNLSPEVSLTYTPTDNLTLFASFRQAYKSGSFVTSGLFSPGDDNSFGDERVRGGEVGIKSVLAGGDLLLNLAGYYYSYKGLQVGSNEISPGTENIIIYTRNAAGAKSYGIDFDLRYKPASIDGLTLSGAVAWNISRFTDFKDAPCWGGQSYDQGCNLDPQSFVNHGLGGYTHQDLTGSPLSRAPEWAITANVDYDMPVGNGMTLAMGFGGIYNSRYLTNILARDDMWQEGYVKLNANIALRGPDDRWELALIGSNLTDKIVTGNCVNSNAQEGHEKISPSITGRGGGIYPTNPSNGSQELLCALDPGRSVTLRASFKF